MQENEKREDNYCEPVKKSWQGLALDWGVARRKQSCVSDSRLHTDTIFKRNLCLYPRWRQSSLPQATSSGKLQHLQHADFNAKYNPRKRMNNEEVPPTFYFDPFKTAPVLSWSRMNSCSSFFPSSHESRKLRRNEHRESMALLLWSSLPGVRSNFDDYQTSFALNLFALKKRFVFIYAERFLLHVCDRTARLFRSWERGFLPSPRLGEINERFLSSK